MPDQIVTKAILAFVKKLDCADDDDALLKTAIARKWLDQEGNPTLAGRELARSFNDLDPLTTRVQ